MSDLTVISKALEVTTEFSKAGNALLGMFNQLYVEPTAIRRKALAQADAYKIVQLAETETLLAKNVLLREGLIRKLNEIDIQEANFRSVLGKAARLLTDGKEPTEPSPDWKSTFVRHAENYSDDSMRNLWASVLAGETSNPGSFSKRTMNVVAELSREEAELFATICRYCLRDIGPIILNFDDPIYRTNGLNYGSLSKFEASGLIVLAANFDHAITGLTPTFGTAYFDRMLHLQRTGGTLGTGKIAFTPAGWELSRIVKADPVPGFFKYLLDTWFAYGCVCADNMRPNVIESILGTQLAPQVSAEPDYAQFGPN